MSTGIRAGKISRNRCTYKALPESVGFEGGIGVDVVMQPPLHCHVPVTHAMSDLHTEVSVVAVNVLDGFEVIFLLFSCGIGTGHKGKNSNLAEILTFNNITMNYIPTKMLVSNNLCNILAVPVILYL